jgi:hypothetical protein
MKFNVNNPRNQEHFTSIMKSNKILKTYNHEEVSELIEFGRMYYAFLNKELTSGEYKESGHTEMEFKILLEMVFFNMCELIKAQSEIEKYQLFCLYGQDMFIHLN